MMISLVACGEKSAADDEKKEETVAAATQAAPASALTGKWESKEAPGTFYEFKDDGTGVLTGEGYSMDFTYEDKGDSVDISYTGVTEAQNEAYTIDGDTLTLAGIQYTKQ